MTTVTRQSMIERWKSAERPLFKGDLISKDGCCCAQGDVLRVCGLSDDDLRNLDQSKADKDVAARLGISVAHSVCLRQANDSQDGCPQDVLDLENGGIQKVLGRHANLVLALWWHIDKMDAAAGNAAWDATWAAAWDATWAAAGAAAGDAAWAAAGDAAGDAARAAAGECCGWSRLTTEPYFLKLLGIADPVAWVEAIDPSANRAREAFTAGGAA